MPDSEEAIKHTLRDIGVDIDGGAENGKDYYIRSFSSEFDNIGRSLKTTDDIWELNTLARALSEMDMLEQAKLDAACALRKCGSAAEVLNLAVNLDRFDYLPADNDEALGEFELETGGWDIPEGLIDSIDCARLGRDTGDNGWSYSYYGRKGSQGSTVLKGYIKELADAIQYKRQYAQAEPDAGNEDNSAGYGYENGNEDDMEI